MHFRALHALLLRVYIMNSAHDASQSPHILTWVCGETLKSELRSSVAIIKAPGNSLEGRVPIQLNLCTLSPTFPSEHSELLETRVILRLQTSHE